MEIREGPAIVESTKFAALAAFRHKNFSIFYAGQTISLFGTWSESLAMSWLVWQLTKSSVWLGIIGFAIQFPMLIFGLFGGVFADKYDRKKSLTVFQILCMLQALAAAALTLTGKIEVWHILLLSIMLGVIYAFEFPVRQSFVMDIVGKRDLLNAVSLNSVMIHGTRMVGPSIAGFIVAWKGEGICFLFNALTFIPLIVALLIIDRSKMIVYKPDNNRFYESIREGVIHLLGSKEMILAMIIMGIVSIFTMPYTYLMPIFADEIFGGGSITMGYLLSASGIGSLIGAAILAGRRSPERMLSIACFSVVGASVSLIIFSHVSNIFFAVPMIALVGAFITVAVSCSITIMQQLSPDELRGRMASFFTVVFMGLAPVGSILGGFATELFGLRLAVSGLASISLIFSMVSLYSAIVIDRKA